MFHGVVLSLAFITPPSTHEPLRQIGIEPIPIAGRYRISGDTTYQGTATITKDDGAYLVVWTLATGKVLIGAGLRHGNYLFVGWTNGDGIDICRYRIEIANGKPKLIGDRGTTEMLISLDIEAK